MMRNSQKRLKNLNMIASIMLHGGAYVTPWHRLLIVDLVQIDTLFLALQKSQIHHVH